MVGWTKGKKIYTFSTDAIATLRYGSTTSIYSTGVKKEHRTRTPHLDTSLLPVVNAVTEQQITDLTDHRQSIKRVYILN